MKSSKVILLVFVFLLVAAGAYLVIYVQNGSVNLEAMKDLPPGTVSTAGTDEVPQTEQQSQGDPQLPLEQPAEDDSDAAGQTEPQTAPEEVVEPELRFMAIGDIMLGRGVSVRLQKAGGFEKAFEKVSDYFKAGDVVFANLETPLTASGHGLDKNGKIVLKGKPESVAALTSAGINLVSLSNNHIMDYYEKGLFDTMDLLNQNGIAFAGAGKNIDEARSLAIVEKNGLKVGLLAYTDMAELIFAGTPYLSFAAGPEKSGVVPRKYESVSEDALKAREQVDILAVSLHWGVEESFKITAEQVEFAHNLIDNGVDIILGHHPHQFQGIEVYKGKPIIYSMGNILFDQNDPENMESFIIDLTYKGSELMEFAAVPVRILEKSYVEIQTGTDAANILERQTELCRLLGTIPITENDVLVFK